MSDNEEKTVNPEQLTQEQLTNLLKKELERRSGDENFKTTLTNELSELIIMHLREKNVFNGAEEPDVVLKKVKFSAGSIVESVQWANLARKMTELAKKEFKGT